MTEFNPVDYWEERLAKNYDISGVGFIALGKAFNHWMYRLRRSVFSRELRRLKIRRDASVLDIGSGTGFYVEALLENGLRNVRGLDVTETAVGQLQARFPELEFVRADISDSESTVRWQDLDVITCMDVLFHITDDSAFDQALRNISGMLRRDGYFVMSDNLPPSEIRVQHQVSRSRSGIENALAANGLKVIREVPMFVLMNAPTASSSRLLHMFWKSLSMMLYAFERLHVGFLGHAVGAVLYPIESLLVRMRSKGPSTKLVVCLKT